MKMSKAEREAYNLGFKIGRAGGYKEGYADGLHDGNPFITLAESINKAVNSIADKLTDPEFIEYLQTLKEEAAKVKEEEEEEEITLPELSECEEVKE